MPHCHVVRVCDCSIQVKVALDTDIKVYIKNICWAEKSYGEQKTFKGCIKTFRTIFIGVMSETVMGDRPS